MRENFGKRLKELIQMRGIGVKEFGESIGVSQSIVSLWINGKRNIKLKNTVAICEYFGCSIEFLIGKSEEIINYSPQKPYQFYPRLIQLMKEKNISRYRICLDLKKSHHHFDQWKLGSDPYLQSLLDLSIYFDLSPDFFIGLER